MRLINDTILFEVINLDPAKYTNRQRKRRLDKARSVSPSLTAGGGGGAGCGSPPTSRRGAVVRQSSVPSRFDEAYVQPNTELEMRYEIRIRGQFLGGAILEPDI